MTIESFEQWEFVLRDLVERIEFAAEMKQTSSYNHMVEFAVQELVQETMRVAAQERYYGSPPNLLDMAIDRVEREVRQRQSFESTFSLVAYRDSLQRSLKYPAKEIVELAGRLRQSRGQEEGEPVEQQYQSEGGVPYVVQAVGQPEAIEALIAKPEAAVFELDLSCLEEELYQVEGDWFPYQISIGEFQLLLDDDGVIYTCTDNFPERLVEQVRAEVVALANRIYTQMSNASMLLE